jgi:hypothetical protein
MSHKRPVTVLRRLWIGYTAIGIAGVVSVVPASFAQDPQVLVHGKSAGTGNEAKERQTHEDMSDGPRSKVWEHMGAFVAEPIGRFWVGPQFVDGETIYVLRIPVRQGLTIVEVSTTPFMLEPSGVNELIGRPDAQPAGW